MQISAASNIPKVEEEKRKEQLDSELGPCFDLERKEEYQLCFLCDNSV